MPVLKPRKGSARKGGKSGQRMDLSIKLAKMAIADWWARDSDNTRYYVNVATYERKNYVRIRIDIPDGEPLTLLLEPDFAINLANAIFRAAFNARIMKPEEVAELWSQLRNQFKGGGPDKRLVKGEDKEEKEEEKGEADIPDFEFA